MAAAKRRNSNASSAALAVAQTDIEYLKEAVAGLKATGDATAAAVDAMRDELTKYRGFWGGAMLVLTALATVFGLFKTTIISKFFGTPKA